MRLSEPFIWSFLENHADGVYLTDTSRHIVFWNRAAERITGYAAADVIGSCCADNILMHVDDQGHALCKGNCPLQQAMSNGISRQAELFLHHKQGHRVPVTVHITPITDEQGVIIGAAELFRNNATCQAEHEIIAELSRAALIDHLTGLPNRRHIEMRLAESIDQLKRYHLPFGFIFADIDHFKHINDTYGHNIGDDILRMVSQTMSVNTRTSDLAGRWGGEEFALLIQQVSRPTLHQIANKLRALVEHSGLHHENKLVHVTITMGATLALPDDTPASLVERADTLLYRGKKSGRNRVITEP